MITVEISGGLGNQMYKFATGYAVAKKKGHKLSIDTSISDHVDFREFGLDYFKLSYEKRISYYHGVRIIDRAFLNKLCQKAALGRQQYISQGNNPYIYDSHFFDSIEKKGKYYLYGGWANYRFFEEYRDDLKKIFQPKIVDDEIDAIAKIDESTNVLVPSTGIWTGDMYPVQWTVVEV